VGGQHHASASLPPGKTRHPFYRRLGGPQGWFGHVRKISPLPGFNARTIQPIASAILTELSSFTWYCTIWALQWTALKQTVVYCCTTTKMNDSFIWYYGIGGMNLPVWSGMWPEGRRVESCSFLMEKKVLYTDVYKLYQALPSSQYRSDVSDNCWPLCPFHLSVVWLYVVCCPGYINCVWVHIPNHRTQKMCFNFQNHVFSWRKQKYMEHWKDLFLLYIVEELTWKKFAMLLQGGKLL
jgi:hypothetical protein